MREADERLESIRAALAAAQQTWNQGGEVVLDTGAAYVPNDPVRIRVRKREHHYDLSDDGAATKRSERPRGWFEVAEGVVAQQGFNVNRAGVVFVPAVEGRDIAAMALRLAEISRDVYFSLLELEVDEER